MTAEQLSGKTERDSIVTACRVLHLAGQSDMVWGHVSIRESSGRGVWLKGSQLGFDEVRPEDIVLLSWEGDIIEGKAGRHIEYPIHLEIMRRRPDVASVVHTHPIHAIAFAATGWPLKALSHEGCSFVPPDIARFTLTGNMVRTPQLGAALADCIGDRNAALMPHHGIVTVGRDIGSAVMAAVELERACQIALLAGQDAQPSSDEEALQKRNETLKRLEMGWEYLTRDVVRDPGVRGGS